MKKVCILTLGLLAAAPLFAQDYEAYEEYPAEDAGTDQYSYEQDSYAGGSDAAEEDEGLPIYIGLDAVNNTIDISSNEGGIGARGEEFDTKLYRLRLGTRLSDNVGAEFHVGIDNSDDDEAETDSYYGLFIVPTATLFEMVEMAFPLGFAKYEAAGVNNSGAAYGIDFELPLRKFAENIPDLRLTAGYMVYTQDNPARVYGANLGLRWDFTTGAIGNPFAGIGNLFSRLNPFDDDEDEGN